MRLLAGLVLIATSVSLGSGRRAPRDSCRPGVGTVRDSGVAGLRLGMTVQAVRSACRVVRDTVQNNDDYVEDERVLVVVSGSDTIVAAVKDDLVARLDILTPGFRTADSLGVGSTLRRLLRLPRLQASVGEASIFAHAPAHCGVSFVLSRGEGNTEDTPINAERLRHWSQDIHVVKMWVEGCRN